MLQRCIGRALEIVAQDNRRICQPYLLADVTRDEFIVASQNLDLDTVALQLRE